MVSVSEDAEADLCMLWAESEARRTVRRSASFIVDGDERCFDDDGVFRGWSLSRSSFSRSDVEIPLTEKLHCEDFCLALLLK